MDIHKTLEAIVNNVDEAIAFYEVFSPTGSDETLVSMVNQMGLHPEFNIVSDALHRGAILALCRIWDTRKDTANIDILESWIEKNCNDERSVHACLWLKEVRSVRQSDELGALKRARNRALAHTARTEYSGTARVAQYGDERRILDRTIALAENANKFFTISPPICFQVWRHDRATGARAFWSTFADRV